MKISRLVTVNSSFPMEANFEHVICSKRPKRKKRTEPVDNKRKRPKKEKKPKDFPSEEEEIIDIETVTAEENTVAVDQLKPCSMKLCGGIIKPHLVDFASCFFKNGIFSDDKLIGEIECDKDNKPINCFGCFRQRQSIPSRGNSKRCNLCDRLQLFLKTQYKREKNARSRGEPLVEKMSGQKLQENCAQELERKVKKYSESATKYSNVICK